MEAEDVITIPQPHAKQREVFESEKRYKVLNWGRRTGKSTFAGIYTLIKALEVQGNYYIVAPTERQAESIYWNDVLKTVIPEEFIFKINNQKKFIEIEYVSAEIELPNGQVIRADHNERMPRSRIYLRGLDNPDNLRGVKLAGCVLDEFAFKDDAMEIYNKVLAPSLGDLLGWTVFISTPNGIHNDFHELVQTAQADPETYFFSHATALDNPYFPRESFDHEKNKAQKEGKTDAFVQEWMAEFKNPAKLVYRMFDRNYHVIDPAEIPHENVTYAMGMDFGWTDPFAVVFIAIDEHQNWYIYDEIYQVEADTERELKLINDKTRSDQYFSRIIGDYHAKTEIANLRAKRFYVTPSRADNDVKGGVREVASLLNLRELPDGKMKPRLFVGRNCKNTVTEFESYSNKTDAYGRTIDHPEENKNNHIMDALRYVVVDYLQHRKRPTRKPRVFDPVTGRMLN
jgi:phage terminase large subunit